MALREVTFTSHNGRDEIFGWIYTPTVEPRAIVQIVHGLGEHSRRYLHVISTLLDAGFVVAADDHLGHGKTAMTSGHWQDLGGADFTALVDDERRLHDEVTEQYPDLPYFMYGHSWGSLIARSYAKRYGADLRGLILGGPVVQMYGLENFAGREELERSVAEDSSRPVGQESAALFAGTLDRFDAEQGPTAWVAGDDGVRLDHLGDPFNNFAATMSVGFLKGFVDIDKDVNNDEWAATIPHETGVLIIAGDQDPVGNYGEGAYHLANTLCSAGHRDVRTRVYTDFRHEVHNEPPIKDEVKGEIVDFVAAHI